MKKHMKKQVMSLFMAVVMVISLIPAVTIDASAATPAANSIVKLESSSTGNITLAAGKTYYITEDTVINNGGTVGEAASINNSNR